MPLCARRYSPGIGSSSFLGHEQVFVFVDRYPRLPPALAPEPVIPAQVILVGGGRVLFVAGPRSDVPCHRTRLLRRAGLWGLSRE
jgi:hypothetical protein